MKLYILLIFSSTLINTNCNYQKKTNTLDKNTIIMQKKEEINKIEISEKTRGTNRIISFTPNSKIISLNDNIITSILSSMEWENILRQTTTIDLSRISLLEAPTTSRYSDRALSSKILIITNEKTYESSEFDAGNPPKELENLYKALIGNAKEKHKPKKNNIR